MLHALQFVTAFSTSIFAGAALYINLVEHPARMELETHVAVRHWAPSYKRPTWMQAPLALIGFVSGAAVWLLGGGIAWLAVAVMIGLAVPFTLIGIMPTNKKLLVPDADLDSAETRRLLGVWSKLHGVRTVLSLAAMALCLWLLVDA